MSTVVYFDLSVRPPLPVCPPRLFASAFTRVAHTPARLARRPSVARTCLLPSCFHPRVYSTLAEPLPPGSPCCRIGRRPRHPQRAKASTHTHGTIIIITVTSHRHAHHHHRHIPRIIHAIIHHTHAHAHAHAHAPRSHHNHHPHASASSSSRPPPPYHHNGTCTHPTPRPCSHDHRRTEGRELALLFLAGARLTASLRGRRRPPPRPPRPARR